MSAAERFERLPTAAKLLLILTAILLPIGTALAWLGETGIGKANRALAGRNEDQARATVSSIESLIARNALALRIAANGALADGSSGACDRARRSVAITPAVAQSFELETADGKPNCAVGEIGYTGALPLTAPGAIATRIAPDGDAIAVRVGVMGGMATALLPRSELLSAVRESGASAGSLVLLDGQRELPLIGPRATGDQQWRLIDIPFTNGNLVARVGVAQERITVLDRLLLLLPLLMWMLAAIVTWWLVTRLLIRPLRRLKRAVVAYRPGGPLDLPQELGPSAEIQELRDAFERAIDRVEESDRETVAALEGQRRLVREVHHRVKNNLQVVASLLNIHGRSAGTSDARDAYVGISRRVGALSIVHRNHFAEMEENRGIALRPLVTELAAELRASAPEAARGLRIDLELDTLNTTQDVAVAVAFLITEMIEFAMLNAPEEPIELALRRTSELTGRLTLGSPVLRPEDEEEPDKLQFERIVSGLAKQLRSPLDRKLGRYSVDLPVFPSD
ncbi:MAG: two-component system, sensor histidine kinase PdtaS [Sphingomonadales bacterium]|nr:two-component system, sensor histidine kinase PdtaS [Sphingomonadales bacterium]